MSIDQQIKCVARELALRRNVYRKRVERGAMTKEVAEYELACMEAVMETLLDIQKHALS
jgi:hypothetical protein